MRQFVKRPLALSSMVLGLWWCAVAAVFAQPAPAPAGGTNAQASQRLIQMDFQDVDLAVLVKFISELTGKNFIIDEKVRGKVTIISPSKISVDEAYLVFQSVLQVKGFTTVPAGSVIKIVPSKEAKSSTIRTVSPNGAPAATDEFITRLIPLKYVDANNMISILQPLVSPEGLLAAYGTTNTLIVIDTAAQTDRLTKILGQLDVEGSEQGIEVVRLNYAFATDIAALLQQVLSEPEGAGAPGAAATQPGRAPSARLRRGAAARARGAAPGVASAITGGTTPERAFKIIPDERTNTLILMAGPLESRRIKDLIAQLDVPLPLGTERIHVYYLKYANAFEMISVLGSLIGGGGGGGVGAFGLGGRMGGMGGLRGSSFSRPAGSSRYGGYGGLGGYGGYGGLGGYGSSRSFGGGYGGFGQSGFGTSGSIGGSRGSTFGGYGGTMGGVSVSGGATGPGQQQSQFQGGVRLSADPSTNALIIDASPQDFDTLKDVIEKLDVRRRQVYVEAIIAEVTLQKTRELGIEFQGVTTVDNGVGIARTNLSGDINSLLQPANLGGLVLAAASNQTVTVNGVTIPAQQALLRALEQDSDANILSAPTVLTTDNQEAEIVAGQNVPFVASVGTNDVNLSNTFTTVDRRDVGITLRITPQISEGGSVRLDIFEEVSDVVSNDPRLGPTTTIRSATTTVVAKDKQTVVIGGLIFNNQTKSQSKVPFFGDIPVLGNFFRYTNFNNRKTNLLVFLTPHIIRNEREQRNTSVGERERILERPFEQRGMRGPNWEALYRPSWEARPSLESPPQEGEPASEVQESRRSVPPSAEAPERAPSHVAAAGTDGETLARAESSSATENAVPTDRYVLLASVWESGTPPTSLDNSNGLLALAVPNTSPLAELFRRGEGYRFEGAGYAASFLCLDVFRTAQEAFVRYPEGMHVSTSPPTYLHWREPTEPSALSTANWARAS